MKVTCIQGIGVVHIVTNAVRAPLHSNAEIGPTYLVRPLFTTPGIPFDSENEIIILAQMHLKANKISFSLDTL